MRSTLLAATSVIAMTVAAVSPAMAQDGTTLAVAPLTVLAESGGVLDVLEARGVEVDGPAWK